LERWTTSYGIDVPLRLDITRALRPTCGSRHAARGSYPPHLNKPLRSEKAEAVAASQ